jgi:hypothetical protein
LEIHEDALAEQRRRIDQAMTRVGELFPAGGDLCRQFNTLGFQVAMPKLQELQAANNRFCRLLDVEPESRPQEQGLWVVLLHHISRELRPRFGELCTLVDKLEQGIDALGFNGESQ